MIKIIKFFLLLYVQDNIVFIARTDDGIQVKRSKPYPEQMGAVEIKNSEKISLYFDRLCDRITYL